MTPLRVAYPTTVGAIAVLLGHQGSRAVREARAGCDADLCLRQLQDRSSDACQRDPHRRDRHPGGDPGQPGAGADLAMLAGPNHRPGQKLMVKPEIKSPADLKGKKLGVTRFGTSDDFRLRYILKKGGLQPDRDVAQIPMGGSQETLEGRASRRHRRRRSLLAAQLAGQETRIAHACGLKRHRH